MKSINLKTIKKLDKKNLYYSIQELSLQCFQVIDEMKKIKIPMNYKKIDNIIVGGMGGSTLGAHIIKSVFSEKLKVPMEIVNNYKLPAYLKRNSLSVISSYSGNTEETISCFNEARKRKVKIFIITSGGKLAALAKRYKISSYIFKPKYNSCNAPRMALGYSIFAQLLLLHKIGLIKITKNEFKKSIETIEFFNKKFALQNKVDNQALKIARAMFEKIPLIIGSEFLVGNCRAFRNQINEGSKNFSTFMEIPEIDHHLLEGLKNPKTNSKNLMFLFFNSNLYYKRNQLRYKITQKIIKQHKINFLEYKMESKTKLSQSLEFLVLGSYASFYLAMLNNLDPSPNPYVDYLKKQMG
ncbi:MAG: SIS domain-containing protein [Xanthomonadaceae bacterium]|nr:SIS domain-containing protein [Rhodospirillaceae bacterium]NIA18038.1 SIS domain-containing protein [Xanthomonadaceae bacterium]